jgi:valyl-tRNA synthetase
MRVTGTVTPVSQLTAKLEEPDRWILSRLGHAVSEARAHIDAYKFAEAANTMYVFVWDELCDWYIELVKARLMNDNPTGAESKRVAEATLVFALENALRMMHPVMPYITEELWHKLPITRSTEFIGQQPYPGDELASLRNPPLEARYALVQGAISAIRTIRAEKNLGPTRPIEAIVVAASADDRKLLEQERASIVALARLQKLDIAADRKGAPEQAATKVTDRLEVIVPMADLLDYGAEALRLKKQIGKNQQERDKLTAKLGNEAFVARAPAEVVERERARVTELGTMIATLEDNLKRAETILAAKK